MADYVIGLTVFTRTDNLRETPERGYMKFNANIGIYEVNSIVRNYFKTLVVPLTIN